MQLAVTFVLPAAGIGALGSLLTFDHPLLALAGNRLLALTVLLARLSYAESQASGYSAVSIALAFLAFYSAIAGVLALGRALMRGPKRLTFWAFLPSWLEQP